MFLAATLRSMYFSGGSQNVSEGEKADRYF